MINDDGKVQLSLATCHALALVNKFSDTLKRIVSHTTIFNVRFFERCVVVESEKKLRIGNQQGFFQTIDSVTIKQDRSEIEVALAGSVKLNPTC